MIFAEWAREIVREEEKGTRGKFLYVSLCAFRKYRISQAVLICIYLLFPLIFLNKALIELTIKFRKCFRVHFLILLIFFLSSYGIKVRWEIRRVSLELGLKFFCITTEFNFEPEVFHPFLKKFLFRQWAGNIVAPLQKPSLIIKTKNMNSSQLRKN